MTAQDHDQSAAPARRQAVIWLMLTGLLALAVAATWWTLRHRPPTIVTVTGETPPPVPLPTGRLAEIDRLTELANLRESQLRQAVDAIDPPVCDAPKALDLGKFTSLRQREADNFTAWRALLDAPMPEGHTDAQRRVPAPAD